MDALLRVYQHIIYDDGLDMGSDSTVVARILIPSEQAVSLIGEQGLMIYSIEEASKTNIYVLGMLFFLVYLEAHFSTSTASLYPYH